MSKLHDHHPQPHHQTDDKGIEPAHHFARASAHRAYGQHASPHHAAPHTGSHAAYHSEAAKDREIALPEAYSREHASPQEQAKIQENQFDWQQYHSAWQRYYQHYYGRHYQLQVNELRREHAQNRAKNAALPAETEEKPAALHNAFVEKVAARSKKLRSSSHFLPIATALCVGLLFFVLQYNKVITAQVNAYVSPSQTISDNVIIDPTSAAPVGKETRLIIPKINVDVPIVLGLESLDNATTQKALENGVVHYPIPGANSLPGQTGNNVILGHSSNDVLAPGDYKFAFVLLERLVAGDIFYIHYDEQRFVYRVSEKEVIEPNEVAKLVAPGDKPLTTLVTCTPIGTDDQRLLVYAEQISPDPADAEKIDTGSGAEREVDIPGNEPGFFERLFSQ